ncbi:hypothetical protein L1049_008639 [Liquidambar formosana]|uniref:MADS-box domain-containing protein n=1 Tax=Liquidambar formosana TaxID=63359 RepID=A0AAP0X2G7_LIQFO
MARKKVKLAWIVNNSARKASLKKRRAGLMKKVAELSTLCGVEACIVVFSPDDAEPMCWPSQAEAKQVLERFFGLPEMERSKKMTTQETFINERIAKLQEKAQKQERIDEEIEMNQIMNQISHGQFCKELDLRQANGLASLMDMKLKEVKRRLQYSEQILSPLPTSPLLPTQTVMADEMGQIGGNSIERMPFMESLDGDQWLMEIMNPDENIASSSGGNKTRLPQGNVGSSGNVGHNGVYGAEVRTSMESLDWDQWLMEIMNPNDNIASTSGGNDMRLPHGNTGTTNDGNGLTQPERNVGSDMVQPQPPRHIGSSSNVRNYMSPPNEADHDELWPYYYSL